MYTLQIEPGEAGAGPQRLLRGQPCTACRRRAWLSPSEELLQVAKFSFALHYLTAGHA